MDTARLDVSDVPPQGGYVAKQCPVRAQWDVIRPADPTPTPASLERRLALGRRFEADVIARLVVLHPDAVVIPTGHSDDRADREAATVAAMVADAPVIIGGRLPTDLSGRRVGEPDLLLRAEAGGYHPVDVKHHRTLSGRRPSARGFEASTAELDAPWRHLATVDPDGSARKHRGDLHQLAHYRRMLEACGHAASDPSAGIVGKELVVTWYDLDRRVWTTPSRSEGTRQRSSMEVYDHEFGFRLDIVATARRHLDDPSVTPLVVPVRIGECVDCPWWGHCREVLEAADDLSLLPRSSWARWKAHHDRGVRTVADLAGLDRRTAALLEAGVDLVGLFAAADMAAAPTAAADLVGTVGPATAAVLVDAGVRTLADVTSLDRRVATYQGAVGVALPEAIDQARARRHAAPALLRRGVVGVDVPRADLEVDLDLESVEDGVYLWGALVTDRCGAGLAQPGYRAFVSWEPMSPEAEAAVFDQLVTWLIGLHDAARAAGRSVRTSCFYETVEAGNLRRIAASGLVAPSRVADVERIVAPGSWLDLLVVARDHLVTGTSLGLKQLAPLAGFAWEDDDPGGEQSMLWHDLAVTDPDPAVRAANRERLLTYNRNDVEATWVLREWLSTEADGLPHLEETDALYGW